MSCLGMLGGEGFLRIDGSIDLAGWIRLVGRCSPDPDISVHSEALITVVIISPANYSPIDARIDANFTATNPMWKSR